MARNYFPIVEREIVGFRLRRTWTGKLVLQIRRRGERLMLTPAFDKYEDMGPREWRDVDANNPSEVAIAARRVEALQVEGASSG